MAERIEQQLAAACFIVAVIGICGYILSSNNERRSKNERWEKRFDEYQNAYNTAQHTWKLYDAAADSFLFYHRQKDSINEKRFLNFDSLFDEYMILNNTASNILDSILSEK